MPEAGNIRCGFALRIASSRPPHCGSTRFGLRRCKQFTGLFALRASPSQGSTPALKKSSRAEAPLLLVPEAGNIRCGFALRIASSRPPHCGSTRFGLRRCKQFTGLFALRASPSQGSTPALKKAAEQMLCCFWCRKRGSNPHPVARTGF